MYVDITDPLFIKVTADPAGVNNVETLIKANIINITPVFQIIPLEHPLQQVYEFPTMTKVVIEFNDGKKFDMELQKVTNQPAWNLGTQAALNQAITDIQASL